MINIIVQVIGSLLGIAIGGISINYLVYEIKLNKKMRNIVKNESMASISSQLDIDETELKKSINVSEDQVSIIQNIISNNIRQSTALNGEEKNELNKILKKESNLGQNSYLRDVFESSGATQSFTIKEHKKKINNSTTNYKTWLSFVDPDDFTDVYSLCKALLDVTEVGAFFVHSLKDSYRVKCSYIDDILVLSSQKKRTDFIEYIKSKYMEDMDIESWYGYKHSMEKDD